MNLNEYHLQMNHCWSQLEGEEVGDGDKKIDSCNTAQQPLPHYSPPACTNYTVGFWERELTICVWEAEPTWIYNSN